MSAHDPENPLSTEKHGGSSLGYTVGQNQEHSVLEWPTQSLDLNLIENPWQENYCSPIEHQDQDINLQRIRVRVNLPNLLLSSVEPG